MRWSAAALLFLLALPGTAGAFNENGYHSGMTLDEVQRSVALRGTRLDLPTDRNEKGVQKFTEVKEPPGNLTLHGGFAFCRGKLFFYTEMLPSTEFPVLVRLAERRTSELGAARHEARSYETRAGLGYHFELAWYGSQTIETISVSQFGHQSVDVSDTFRDSRTAYD